MRLTVGGSLKLFGCIACCCVPVFAQDSGGTVERPSRAQCDAWVQQLANRSERPFDRYVLEPPRNVDRKALAEVKAAYDKLSIHFSDALPSLIGGLSDKRYSYYQEVPSNGAFECHDVGDACYDIISAHIEVYRRHLYVLDRTQVPRTVHFLSEMGGAGKWHHARQDRSLFDLQLEAVDWALRQPPDDRVKRSDWDNAVAELRRFRDDFAKGKKPFDPMNRLWFVGK